MDTISQEELHKYFRSLSNEITEKFKKMKIGTSHSGGKGEEGEEVVREFLATFIGNLFTIYTRRQIVDSENRRTHQNDVIITHKNMVSQGLMDSERSYLFAESVACVIEVKAVLDQTKLKDAIGKLRELNQLKITGVRGDLGYSANGVKPRIHRAIFAYAASGHIQQILHSLLEYNDELKISKEESIDWIFIQDKGMILRSEGGVVNLKAGGQAPLPREYYALETGKDTLLSMLQQLQGMDVMILRRYNPNAYFSKVQYNVYG